MIIFDTLTIISGNNSSSLYGNLNEKQSIAKLKSLDKYFDKYQIINNDIVSDIEIINHEDKYVRIRDPRGFFIYITIENFVNITQNCDISNGIIKSKCCWSKKVDNYLIPVDSDEYKEYRKKTDKLIEAKTNATENGLTLTQLENGDVVTNNIGEKLVFIDSYKIQYKQQIAISCTYKSKLILKTLEDNNITVVSVNKTNNRYESIITINSDLITTKEKFLFQLESNFNHSHGNYYGFTTQTGRFVKTDKTNKSLDTAKQLYIDNNNYSAISNNSGKKYFEFEDNIRKILSDKAHDSSDYIINNKDIDVEFIWGSLKRKMTKMLKSMK